MYVKLFASILDSSIWSEDHATVRLWITMLAMADEHGIVHASLSGLANRARLSITECTAALEVLMSPDPESRTEAFEGRRLERIAGGWVLLNYTAYREIRTRSQMSAAARQARFRERHRDSDSSGRDARDESVTPLPVTEVTTNASASASVSEREVEKEKTKDRWEIFGVNADLVGDLVFNSRSPAAVAASIFKHTLGSYNAGMAGAPVAHPDVVGAAVQAYLANMKEGDQFVDRLFGGYVRDAIRTMGVGEQRDRAKREDAFVDRERVEQEQADREEAATARKLNEFKRTHPDVFATYSAQAERLVDSNFKGLFRAPVVRAKLLELIDQHDGGGT